MSNPGTDMLALQEERRRLEKSLEDAPWGFDYARQTYMERKLDKINKRIGELLTEMGC